MKQAVLAFGVLLAAMLACAPSPGTKEVSATITTYTDEHGTGTMPDPYSPLPGTLVIATWNQHGNMFREVKQTDQNGRADFSVEYTHFFDLSVFPPCGYYSTSPLHRDMSGTETASFGFWPSHPAGQPSTVKVLVWTDRNANGGRDPQEEVTGKKASVMFGIPGGVNGNPYDQDNFVQDARNGWFEIPLGNSCGTIYLLLLDSDARTNSVSAPARESDAGTHGNTVYPAIEIPYLPGETTAYWELK